MTHHQVIIGDARQMNEVRDASVHLIVTSPPYWQLKDYGSKEQIGFHDSYEQYINHLNLVWSECFRVLHDGCRLCVNIGDQFARSVYYGRYKVIPIREEIIKYCEILGFDYMGAVIWQKVTTTNTSGGASIMGSFPYPRNGILKLDYEFILLFKKQGTPPKPSAEAKERSKMTTEEWNTFFAGHWNFSGERQEGHLAMFPEELPRRLIRMFSLYGETVLDPFLGSGTTALAAKNTGRNSVGYEINPAFEDIIRKKVVGEQVLFQEAEISIALQAPFEAHFEERIQQAPYIFRDPHTLNTKIDPKKLYFGSRIDAESPAQRDEFFSVKEVMSSERVRLNNDVVVRLLGVKEVPASNGKAREFLLHKTKGQKVFLKFDAQKYDADNTLLGYLYLQNKTFLNAHLIKHGLAEVDEQADFRYKQKFVTLWQQYGRYDCSNSR
jgi:site-specific DNA-methyltransferase (adenine-specific)